MRIGRDWIAWCLLTAAVGCLGVALFPQWHEWDDPATGDRVSERRLGLWFSPVHQTVHRAPPQGGFTWHAGVNWISWSSLLVVIGVVCFETFRQRLRSGDSSAPVHNANASSEAPGTSSGGDAAQG